MALVLEILIFLKNISAYKNRTDRNMGIIGGKSCSPIGGAAYRMPRKFVIFAVELNTPW